MNIAIESVIVSLLGFFSCIVFIACKPSGVAALPIPRRFAIIFIVISLYSLSSLFIFGNKNFISGLIILLSLLINEDFCTIFINPFHKHIVPNNFIIRSTAWVHELKIELLKLFIFPVNKANINEIIIKNGHILFSICTSIYLILFKPVFNIHYIIFIHK